MARFPTHKRDASRRVWLWHENKPTRCERSEDEEPPAPEFPAWLVRLLGLEA